MRAHLRKEFEMIRVLFLLLLVTSLPAFASNPESSKTVVVSFYKMAFGDHKPRAAADQFIGDKYIQHNPKVPDGKKAFVDFFEPFFKGHPEHHAEITQVIADGNLVALHVHSQTTKEERGRAIVDIFRVENGKIVEHWDVIQDIPEKSVNSNTMF